MEGPVHFTFDCHHPGYLLWYQEKYSDIRLHPRDVMHEMLELPRVVLNPLLAEKLWEDYKKMESFITVHNIVVDREIEVQHR
ncbi:hypothetical protein TKK_0009041 [Trichogramma kaykai]